MLRSLAVIVGLLLPSLALGGDAIPPETITAVKRATVFVKVEGPGWKASGSGFVVAADKDSVLIATNHHVVSLPENEKKHLTPAELIKSLKVPAVTVVFDSGTKTELSAKAEIVTADVYYDLAILRVTGLKEPPAPIEYANTPPPVETMTVYTFGFPFGQALATGEGAPAITVGKGAVSSLRNDDDGELAVVQIDGALNPGNSGGPVVDAKGRLVGVAVATLKQSQGIGFAVPSAELGKVMRGRVGGFHLTASKTNDGKLSVAAELGVIDPIAAVRGITFHYLVVPPNGVKPKAQEPLEQQAGAKKVVLKLEGGVASGSLVLDRTDGELFIQAIPDGGAGMSGAGVRSYPLQPPKGSEAIALGRPVEAYGDPGQGDPRRPGTGGIGGRPVTPFIPAPPIIPALPPIRPIPPITVPRVSLPKLPGVPGPPRPMPPVRPIPPIRPVRPM